MSNFPFKTLIWAIVIVTALFLFKSSWERFILKVETVKLFDQVEVSLSESESKKLESLFEEQKKEIISLTNHTAEISAESKIISAALKAAEIELAKCNSESELTKYSTNQFTKIEKANQRAFKDAEKLLKKKVFTKKKK